MSSRQAYNLGTLLDALNELAVDFGRGATVYVHGFGDKPSEADQETHSIVGRYHNERSVFITTRTKVQPK